MRKTWPQEAERFAITAFIGLQFSLLLTAVPGMFALVFGIVGLIGRLLGVVHKEPL